MSEDQLYKVEKNIPGGRMKKEDLEQVKNLVKSLCWQYPIMSKCGKEEYKKLCLALGWDFIPWYAQKLGLKKRR